MQNWFFAKEGKAQGPKSKVEIENLLKDGALTPETMLFREGEKEWKRAKEYPEFEKISFVEAVEETSQTVKQELPHADLKDVVGPAKWVLLSRNLEDTQPGRARYDQHGPFTKEEVIRKIEAGEAKWTDHVWAQGYKAWARISSLKDFNAGLEFAEVKKEIQASGSELLSHVMKAQTPAPSSPTLFSEYKPTEVKGENQTKAFVEFKSDVIVAKPVPAVVLSPVATTVEAVEEVTQSGVADVVNSKWFTPKRAMLYGGTFVVVGLILSISLLFSKPESQAVKTREVATVPAVSPVPASSVAQTTPPPVESVKAEPPKKFVKIVPLKLDSNTPQLAFETNVDPGEAITVLVKNLDGQILELVRYSRSARLARGANELPTLDLSKWALPHGAYVVEVKAAGESVNQQIFIGQKNRQFQTELEKHNKKIMAQRNAEKKALEASIKKLEGLGSAVAKNYGLAKKNPQKWMAFYKGWAKEVQIASKGLVSNYKPAQSDRYVYPKTIEGIRSASAELSKTGKALNDALKSKRSPASVQDVKSVQQKLKALRSELR